MTRSMCITWASAAPLDGTLPARAEFGALDVVMLALAAASMALIVLTRWRRLQRAPRRPDAFSAIAAFALLCAMLVLGRLGAIIGASIFDIQPDTAGTDTAPPIRDIALMSLCGALGSALVLPVFMAIVRAARTPAPDMRFSRGRTVLLSVSSLLVIWPVVAAAGAVTAWLLGAPDEIAHQTLRELSVGPLDRPHIMLVVLAVLAAPVLEEVMYRGLLQEALIQLGLKRWPAIALTSVAFAAAHVGAADHHVLPALFVLSLALGWAYEKTGRLWAPILMHALFNAGNFALARMAAG
jgi:membrane protease YdiL (CAAX protease family)